MKIFLSHASADKDATEQVYYALIGDNHQVFFDDASLPPGDDYNSRIRTAILASDLLVFLISDDSVADSSYALTELAIAHGKWPHPKEGVMPVMLRKTAHDRIPNYLKAVTILEPKGNVAAAVANEIAKVTEKRTTRSKLAKMLGTYRRALAAFGIIAVVAAVAMLHDAPLNRDKAMPQEMRRAILEMEAKLQAMEAESAEIKANYEALRVSFSRLRHAEQQNLNAQLESELVTRFEALSLPSDVLGIGALTQHPGSIGGETDAPRADLIAVTLRELDKDIDRQAQLIQSLPPSASIDVETMKLKRLIDQRSQLFDTLRQIIDKYNQTAKGIIDSIGR